MKLKSSSVACRAVELVETAHGHVDHVVILHLFGASFTLPDEGPDDDNQQLSGQEESAGDDDPQRVDAAAGEPLFDEDLAHRWIGVVLIRQQIVVVAQVVAHLARMWFGRLRRIELVDDFDGLNDEQLFLAGVPSGPAQIPLLATEGIEHADVAREVDDVTLDGLAAWQAGRHQRPELDLVRRGELESVEGAQQDLVGLERFADDAHDGGIGRTAALVDQQDFVVVDGVEGDQVAHEDLVRTVLVDDFEAQVESVAYLSRHHVHAVFGSDAHDDVGRIDDGLLAQHRRDVPADFQVDLIGHALVAQIVLTVNGETQIGAGDDAVVVLQDDVVGVATHAVLVDVALDVVVGHAQFKVETGRDVVDARVGAPLGVDLAVEDLAGADLGHHVARTAVDRHVVARTQFVRRCSGYLQIRLLTKHIQTKQSSSTITLSSHSNLPSEMLYISIDKRFVRLTLTIRVHLSMTITINLTDILLRTQRCHLAWGWVVVPGGKTVTPAV